MANAAPLPLTSSPSGPLKGSISVPGDKSISHRALMLGAVAIGRTRIRGLLEGEDVLRTAAALRELGIESGRDDQGWWVEGQGTGALSEPGNILDLGNSGTSTRLLMGLVGSHNFNTQFTGDASLRKRPMARVIEPLSQMGVNFLARDGGKLPITVLGTRDTTPITYRLPVASAQVKSAILLCALNTQGLTTVIEPEPTRDHTEIMLRHFGAEVGSEKGKNGEVTVSLRGYPELKAQEIDVPGDPSSSAFVVAAALLKDGSELTIKNTGINPLRAGFYETLKEMGADIHLTNQRLQSGEKTADVKVKASALKGVRVPASRAPSMIDEYPILAVLASFASGKTVMEGLKELRVKESDRLAMIASSLSACGVKVEVDGDNLIVHGTGKGPKGGAKIATSMDHRIAMSFLVMGSAAQEPVSIDDGSFINTSFPGFVKLMNETGAKIS